MIKSDVLAANTQSRSLNKQLFFPKPRQLGPHDIAVIRTLGVDRPEGHSFRRGKDWRAHQALHHDNFMLNVLEEYQTTDSITYTRQEDYLKVNFWLGGRHTTILDGFGQHDHDRPEVFITAGPWEMVKVDAFGPRTRVASVALCLKRDFFPSHLGLEPDQLPEPLRGVLKPPSFPYAFYQLPLSPNLVAAARSILATPPDLRRQALYLQAKAVELMCLLIHRMESYSNQSAHQPWTGRELRIRDAHEFLANHYPEPITLERICREVGINKMSLTSGFRELFGMSVYDCLNKIRMGRALELLRDEAHTIGRVAEAVGYRHPCNFSTAFREHFGCTPQSVRGKRR